MTPLQHPHDITVESMKELLYAHLHTLQNLYPRPEAPPPVSCARSSARLDWLEERVNDIDCQIRALRYRLDKASKCHKP